ncbi:M50 family metallopeptidase [Arthrobacter sp. P2b]|uniref:M50 family metallopeptidase n=1 Tax=Arthrobacter sp. P2b TaxID=1938741 RepID=UPI0009A752F6|nr:M50 family metallopeptidase [Arthrobacter sp. P2b]SLK07073.1 putative peptide zinc metalloprotease protein [Arthrobacter sp. P2b]
MSHATGGPRPEAGPPSSHASLAERPLQVPVRADGVQLLGQSEGSGYREAPSLVRRADGQTLQLTRLLYLVLEGADGTRDVEEIAQHATQGSGRLVSAENVRTLMDSQLLPMGLLRLADGSQPEVKKADPLLGMRFRYTVTDPERTRKITAPFAALFNPLIVVAVTAAFLAACWWVLMVKGLGSATHEAFANPALLLLIFAITVLSAGFHEFGHAAAARKGGATPGAMGAGLYLVWPAFFTDVTDSYRLSRGGRLRTDLGGLYFNAIVAVAIMGLWWATGFDALLLVVVTQILQMVRQLLPLVRFDGYHILADTTGVPDLFQRIKPTLLGLLPWHWGRPENKVLKPWARAVVTVWVLVTVPLLLFSLAMMVLALPRLLATAWDSASRQQDMLAASLSDGDLAGAAVRALAIAAVALPMLGMLYILFRLLRQLVTGLWKKTRGKVLQRTAAMAAVAALLAGLGWAWWPDGGTYRPVQPYERGTLADATSSIVPQGSTVLREGRSGTTVALWPEDAAKPTRENPQLSMVLVPAEKSGSGTASAATAAGTAAPSWVFPFDRPAAPEEDGNQALAVNTTDGSVTYSVAFALVWAEDGEPVDTRNEAYAFANCTGCAAVAVGFQVVLIVGEADVIVPENLSAAANYNCVDCLTYALASQLVLTMDGPLGTSSLEQLNALWAEIAEYGRNIQNVPLSEIQARIAAYKEQITAIIKADPSATRTTGTPAPTGTAAPTGTNAPGGAPTGPAFQAPGGGAPATQPSVGDPPPSYAPIETPLPTADTGGTAPAVEPQPTANPS